MEEHYTDAEIVDLEYALDWLSGLMNAEFEAAVCKGKVAFLGAVLNLPPRKLARLARKHRAEKGPLL